MLNRTAAGRALSGWELPVAASRRYPPGQEQHQPRTSDRMRWPRAVRRMERSVAAFSIADTLGQRLREDLVAQFVVVSVLAVERGEPPAAGARVLQEDLAGRDAFGTRP